MYNKTSPVYLKKSILAYSVGVEHATPRKRAPHETSPDQPASQPASGPTYGSLCTPDFRTIKSPHNFASDEINASYSVQQS